MEKSRADFYATWWSLILQELDDLPQENILVINQSCSGKVIWLSELTGFWEYRSYNFLPCCLDWVYGRNQIFAFFSKNRLIVEKTRRDLVYRNVQPCRGFRRWLWADNIGILFWATECWGNGPWTWLEQLLVWDVFSAWE